MSYSYSTKNSRSVDRSGYSADNKLSSSTGAAKRCRSKSVDESYRQRDDGSAGGGGGGYRSSILDGGRYRGGTYGTSSGRSCKYLSKSYGGKNTYSSGGTGNGCNGSDDDGGAGYSSSSKHKLTHGDFHTRSSGHVRSSSRDDTLDGGRIDRKHSRGHTHTEYIGGHTRADGKGAAAGESDGSRARYRIVGRITRTPFPERKIQRGVVDNRDAHRYGSSGLNLPRIISNTEERYSSEIEGRYTSGSRLRPSSNSLPIAGESGVSTSDGAAGAGRRTEYYIPREWPRESPRRSYDDRKGEPGDYDERRGGSGGYRGRTDTRGYGSSSDPDFNGRRSPDYGVKSYGRGRAPCGKGGRDSPGHGGDSSLPRPILRNRHSSGTKGYSSPMRRSRSLNDITRRSLSPRRNRDNLFPVCSRFPNCSVCTIDIPQNSAVSLGKSFTKSDFQHVIL